MSGLDGGYNGQASHVVWFGKLKTKQFIDFGPIDFFFPGSQVVGLDLADFFKKKIKKSNN